MKLRRIASIVLLAWVGSALGQTITIGLNQDPPHLDPAIATATSEYDVLHQMFDTLVRFDANLKILPGLATSWSVSSDGLTYTFHLREGVKFQDGTPLNAEAVKWSLDRARTLPNGAFKNDLAAIDTVSAVDHSTVTIHLKHPYSPLLLDLTGAAGMIVSPTAAAKGEQQFDNNPVGSGPYSFVSRTRQDNITLKANPDYWGGAPKVAELIFRPFPDGSVRLANLQSGAAQLINPLEPKDVATVKKDPKLEVSSTATVGWRIIVLNTKKPPFNDVRVRQAFSLMIDRQTLSKVVFLGTEEPAGGPFPPGTGAYDPSEAAPSQDIAKAKALLQQAGVPHLSFTLLTIARSPENEETQVIQAMAAQAGVTIKIDPVEVGQYLQRTTSGNYQAVTMQWSGQPDPDTNIYSFFVTDGYWNWSGYSNTQVDALLTKAREVSPMSERRTLYTQALAQINKDAPVIWLTHQRRLLGLDANLTGITVLPDGVPRLQDLSVK